MRAIKTYPFFIRLFHWEYWSSKVVYAPLYPYWLWLSIRSRSFFFPTAANPTIENGGFIMESKKAVYDLIPPKWYPRTVLLHPGMGKNEIMSSLQNAQISFPLIAKPDYGERGLGVKKVHDEAELLKHISSADINFIAQEYIGYEQEAGIFFVKLPGDKKGRITGIVHKTPVTIKGDGIATIQQLVFREPRYILQWKHIKKEFAQRLDEVLKNDEELILIPYGNHVRGSMFTNQTRRLTPLMEAALLGICNSIEGFNFGRLDIRFSSWEALEKGAEFSIIELNGSGSEPTHIYDPKQRIWFAWKEIIKHWRWLFLIANAQKKNGVIPISFTEGQKALKAFRKIEAKLVAAQ